MDITKLTTEELKKELDRRGRQKEEEDNYRDVELVFGTCSEEIIGGKAVKIIEHFLVVRNPDDLNFLSRASLRARFNTHRNYKAFYFKTSMFKELAKELDRNVEALSTKLLSNPCVKFATI